MTITTADDDLCRLVEPNVCPTSRRVEVLNRLNEANIPTVVWLCPILPHINDTEENILALKKIVDAHPCVDKIELLPFRKICQTKYDTMKLSFPLADTPEPSAAVMKRLNALLQK